MGWRVFNTETQEVENPGVKWGSEEAIRKHVKFLNEQDEQNG